VEQGLLPLPHGFTSDASDLALLQAYAAECARGHPD